MQLPNGYTMTTTFPQDFAIADKFGKLAVADTYRRAFDEWKEDIIYMTELYITLNHGIFKHYGRNEELAILYDNLWRELGDYIDNTFNEEDLSFFYRAID